MNADLIVFPEMWSNGYESLFEGYYLENKEIVTFYKSRTITKGEPTYTDYILESEIPDGYQTLDGSDLKQYRYKEKCGK